MRRQVLIIVAHPDDEVLGCGGTIAKHVTQGDIVSIVYMADGVKARSDANNCQIAISERLSYAKNACTILGAKIEQAFTFEDNRLDQYPLLDIVQPIETIIQQLQPEIIYTHFS